LTRFQYRNRAPRNESVTGVAALLVAAVMLFWGLGSVPLMQPDEGRNAEVAREMAVSGSWLVPTLEGHAYLDKPAAYFATVAASLELFGVNEWGARVPSALFGLAILALVYAFAARAYDRATAAFAVIVVATSPMVFAFSRIVIMDIALGACTLLRLLFEVSLVGPDHHDHVAALLLRHRLDDRELVQVDDQTIQDLATEIRVRHLAPTEHDRDLDLVPSGEEPRDVPLLGGVVVRIDLRSELDLFQAGPRLLPAGLLQLHVLFVLVLAVIHDPTHRRICLRRDLDEIQIERAGLIQGLSGLDDPDLRSVMPDQANLCHPDPVVDPGIC